MLVQWYTSVIPATGEGEVGESFEPRISGPVPGQHKKKKKKTKHYK
jgi:hypothetical protein